MENELTYNENSANEVIDAFDMDVFIICLSHMLVSWVDHDVSVCYDTY